MDVNYSSFVDELEKIAIDEVLMATVGGAAAGTLGGIANLPVGGKSLRQRRVDKRIEQALQEPGLTEKKVKRLAKEKRQAQVQAEMSYGQLITAPAGLAGLLVARKLGKKIKGSDVGTPRTVRGLKKELHSQMRVVPVSGAGKAVFIPEGGALPKILRPLEERMYRKMGLPMEEVKQAIRRGGAAFAPYNAPEFVGHELGHAALRRGKWPGRLWTAGRLGAPIVALTTASYMLGAEDPKDWKVKAAPAVAALGSIPLLAEEALASRKGMKAVKKVMPDLSTKVVKGMKGNLRKALATYGIMAGASVLPTLAMSASRAIAGESPKKTPK